VRDVDLLFMEEERDESLHYNAKRTLKRREWLRMPEEGTGILVHDVHCETESF
jgi:NTE family protein